MTPAILFALLKRFWPVLAIVALIVAAMFGINHLKTVAYNRGRDDQIARANIASAAITAKLVPKLAAIETKTDSKLITQNKTEDRYADSIRRELAQPTTNNCNVSPDIVRDENAIRASLDSATGPDIKSETAAIAGNH